jgi:transglutaminase-like putative cysteine protease
VCGKKLRRFAIVVDLVVELIPINPFDFFVEESASSWPFRYEPWLIEELGPSLNAQVRGPRLDAWLAAVPQEETPTIELLVELNRRLARDVAYVRRMEPGVQPPDETLRMALGSCRDSAWLLVQILRRLGIAARFVSGYLVQLASESAAAGDGPEADMADLHAWAEAFIPGAGGIGLDPTSGLLAGEGHLPLAGAATPDSVAPVIGSHEPTDTSLEHTITVKRLALDATAVE